MIDVDLIGAPAFLVEVRGTGFIYRGVNARLSAITGMEPRAIVGRSPEECLPQDVAAAVVERYRACVALREAVDSEGFHDLPNGGRWWAVTLTPLFDHSGAVSALFGLAADVTARRAAERARQEADARAALALDVLDGGFWEVDLASGALTLSAKLATALGAAGRACASWTDFVGLVHPDDREAVAAHALPLPPAIHRTEYRVAGADGALRWLRSSRRIVEDETGQVERVSGVVVDITDHKDLQAVFERQAVTDPLTQVLNRRGFERGAARLLERMRVTGDRFALLLIDLDGFKPINDRYGHAAGDLVLASIAARLQGAVRGCDEVARLGGDEFAILIDGATAATLTALADRLLVLAREPVLIPGGLVQVGASLGGTLARPGDRSIAEITLRADQALYEVKHAGRGHWRVAA